ncbi:MAG: helix-turn-helix domain-containing protein [Treponema sp.]|nr:helix-turn-helix domain-containing protein [Treponema sp.]
MFKTTYKGQKNLIGENFKKLRQEKFPYASQRQFAEKLQLNGMDVGKNRISKIERGESFVNDIELQIIARTLDVEISQLLTRLPVEKELYEYKEAETIRSIANSTKDNYSV